MILMVSLLVMGLALRGPVLLHRIISDGEEMGLAPLPDNRPSGHMIYAFTVENNVKLFIDTASLLGTS
jgi:hypothetical protein